MIADRPMRGRLEIFFRDDVGYEGEHDQVGHQVQKFSVRPVISVGFWTEARDAQLHCCSFKRIDFPTRFPARYVGSDDIETFAHQPPYYKISEFRLADKHNAHGTPLFDA